MNQQCYQCHTAHDDNALTAVSGVWLCPKCNRIHRSPLQTYGVLVSSASETLTQVRDMVAALEAGGGICCAMRYGRSSKPARKWIRC